MKRLRQTGLWMSSIFLAFVFVAVGLSKLEGSSATRWAQRFLSWGYLAGSQYVVGAIEIIAGIAMVIPPLRKVAAGIVMVIMAGALYTHVRHGEFLRVLPPIFLGGLALIVFSLHSQPSESSKGDRAMSG